MRSKTASLHPFLILLAIALISVLFVVSCGDDEATAVPGAGVAEAEAAKAGEPKRGGKLTMAIVSDFQTLDPVLQLTTADVAITQQLYDNLLMIQPDGSVKPELATSWEANDDLSSFTFHLRKGVRFYPVGDYPGKDFKAEDVLASFARLMDPVLDAPIRLTFTEAIEDIVAVDDYTVRFDLVGPNAFFLDTISVLQARMVPADVDVDRLHQEAFGTGPFIMVEHLPGERTTMMRNPDYWDEGKPYLDELTIQLISEVAARDAALKSGDVDVVYDLQPQSVPAIEAHPDTLVLENSSNAWIGLVMRVDQEPFDNVLVRKAMQAATDRDAIRQVALLGRGVIAYDHVVPPSSPLFAPQHKPPDYDPELAKQLLAEAGYPDGVDIVLHTADIGTGMNEMAVAFKESAAPAGIRVDLQRQAAEGFMSEFWFTEPLTVTFWFGRPNPDQALSVQSISAAPWNASRFFSDRLDELVLKARGERLEDQKVSYAEIQKILIDNVPRIIVAYKPVLYGVGNDVRGVNPHPLGWAIFNEAWLDD